MRKHLFYNLSTIEYKQLRCPDCWENTECLECGCNIEEMFLSDKPCPKGRF